MDKVLNTLEPQPVFTILKKSVKFHTVPLTQNEFRIIASVSPKSGDLPAIRTTPITLLS